MRVETAQIVTKAEVQASLILAAAAEQEALKHRELAARLAKGVCLLTAAVVTGRPDCFLALRARSHELAGATGLLLVKRLSSGASIHSGSQTATRPTARSTRAQCASGLDQNGFDGLTQQASSRDRGMARRSR
jgi:hypothetical protein